MNRIQSVKHELIRRFSNLSRPRKLEDGSFFFSKGSGKNISEIDLLDAFSVPEVNAILNKRASAHSNIEIQVVNKKTLELVENNISSLLKNPNWHQSIKEFINQTNLFHDIYGNEFIYMMFGIGIRPENSKALYSLVPEYMDIDYKSESLYFQETEMPNISYDYKFDGKETKIDPEQIIHLNDNRVKITRQDETLIKGESKLSALSMPINNIISAYEARGILIRNRGALGILSNQAGDGIGSTIPIDPQDKENLQNEYKNYGISADQWQIIITSMNLKWQQMGVDVGSLKLFEEVRADTIKVAEAFNYPPELLGKEGSPNIFGDNKKDSEKSWYQNSIIPEAQQRIDAMNAAFETEGKPYTIIGKFDHLPIFQKDLKDKVSSFALVTNALSKAFSDDAITLEEYQHELKRHGFIEE